MTAALCLLLTGCANRGIGPQGGPKDTIPPVVVKETPANGSNHFTDKKIEILFNEYLQLDNVQTNLLVSPPQQVPPEVKAQGKKGQIVEVSDAYGRNVLIAKKLGVEATPKALNDLKLQKKHEEKVAQEQYEAAVELG